jgi:hypothetical protein
MSNPLILPCCDKSFCVGDAPIQNLSAEASDGPSFIGVQFGGQLIPPVGTTYRDPNTPCFTTSSSQFGADTSAQRCQVIDTTDNPNGGGGDWHNPTPPLYGNRAQTCSVRCADGLAFNYTIPAGTYLDVSQIVADRIANSFACQFAAINKVCLSSLSGSACLDQPYDDTIIPLGRAPFTFSIISGALPPGLTFSSTPTVARVSGTPTTVGLYTFQVRAVSANGNFMQKTFRISVLDIANKAQCPKMTSGTFYSFQLIGVGGMAPYVFSSEDLPEFLSISEDGLISGFPLTTEAIFGTVTISDALGNSCDFSLSVSTACPVFDSLVWDSAPFIIDAGPNPPNSSGYVVTANGKNYEINAAADMVVLGQPLVYDTFAVCSDFTTEQIDCTLQVLIKSQTGGGFQVGTGGWSLDIQIFDNIGGTIYLEVAGGVDFSAVGVYQFPVTIPAGIQIGVAVSTNVGDGDIFSGPISGAIDVLVTFGV